MKKLIITIKYLAFSIPLLLLSTQTHAIAVDTELSLVVDVSESITEAEYNMMMDGYANAFRNDLIQNNILSTANNSVGALAVNLIFFDGSALTTALDSFTLLNSTESINSFADIIDNLARIGGGGTIINTGVKRATELLLSDNGFESDNLVIDVSGDGVSDSALMDRRARDAAETAGITINGITIGSPDIETYYRNNVITSNGFTKYAGNFDEFELGILSKLAIETTSPGFTTANASAIPSPAPLALMGIGLISFVVGHRKKKQ